MPSTTRKVWAKGHFMYPRVNLTLVPNYFWHFCVASLEANASIFRVHNGEYSNSIWMLVVVEIYICILCLYGCQWREGIMIAYQRVLSIHHKSLTLIDLWSLSSQTIWTWIDLKLKSTKRTTSFRLHTISCAIILFVTSNLRS